VRVLPHVSRRSLSIQPNWDALCNTVVSASLVHLVDAPDIGQETRATRTFCHLSHLKIHVTETKQTNDTVRLTLNFFVCPSVVL
jgi:hypothetical protein